MSNTNEKVGIETAEQVLLDAICAFEPTDGLRVDAVDDGDGVRLTIVDEQGRRTNFALNLQRL